MVGAQTDTYTNKHTKKIKKIENLTAFNSVIDAFRGAAHLTKILGQNGALLDSTVVAKTGTLSLTTFLSLVAVLQDVSRCLFLLYKQ